MVPALAARFAESLLPGEAEGMDSERLTEAASFTLTAMATRAPGEPGIALESIGGSAGERFLRLAVINDDMPFLVDSVAAAVAEQGLTIERLVHPVIAVRRDGKGRLVELAGEHGDGECRESVIYLETERGDARQRRLLAATLVTVLGDVHAAVDDWSQLQQALIADAERIADPEGAALLRWLNDGMLTQLGHVLRKRDGSQSGLLGICRKSARGLLAAPSFERAFRWFDGQRKGQGQAPLIIKANRVSNVHRRAPLDLFIVPVIEDGSVVALSVHAGVWTSAALAAPPDRIPRMRSQLAQLMDRFGFDPAGHAGKSLVHALTALPHDLLIGFAEPDLARIATAMMSLVDRPRPKLALVKAPLARHLFAFVWLPRDVLSTTLRLEIQTMLEAAAKAEVLDWSLQVEGSSLALLRFVIDIRETGRTPDEAALDAELQAMVRGWPQAVEAELAQGDDPARAAALATRFAEAFPSAYRTFYGAGEAAADIRVLRALGGSEAATRRAARLYRLPGTNTGLRLKLYQREGTLPLSDAVPVLENFGFRVMEEVPTLLDAGRIATIHDFLLSLPAGQAEDAVLARAGAIETAIAEVLNGEAEDDPFNRLIVTTALDANHANWLRAWFRYLRQGGMGFGIATVVDALRNAPQATRALLALFAARHDPAFGGDRARAAAAADRAFRDSLGEVAAINDDRLLRLYRALIESILRTNAFAPSGQEALAFKLDPALVPNLPKPLPWREIFVYSSRLEGIHLRAGPIARGGLRWSDRRDDFRTEILGLMKAQRVKNAVIVPTGAKGGFYPKRLPDPAIDREGWLAEGKASYQVFIRTLLSITDNIVNGKVVHPARVVIHDGEDPYFVVAADKGTATFSDVANAIADEADFWLDDAFASGGSNGYDHKAMGITARGAWISVQRHFLEMGVDVQRDPVTVAGVGDMSGDVFGNGMLLSKSIRLVAAFDHRHIFLDPHPDAAKSWQERARMFALPRSSWADYNTKLISKGGGVFARSLKEIPLSPQVRELLGIENPTIDPDGLMHAILSAQVDLLWFGGIGTYVRASGESNAAVGDPANDAIRLAASELHAKIIGEGANLGITQSGRIEFALAGGRINTDFIDNSAGVDCSDNEVNIKIALASARRAKRITLPARNALLESMTGQVAGIVLEDNRLQALALSIAQTGGAAGTPAFARLIEQLEDRGQLDRRTEGLPESDALARRAADGAGLTRPELAVLLSSAKLVLQQAIEQSALPDDPGLADELLSAFPAPMRRRFRSDILGHRLRREIIATRIANRIVNRIGVIHPFELIEEEGTTLAHIATCFVASERLFAMADIWAALERAAMPEAARLLLFRRCSTALRTQIADLVRVSSARTAASKLIAELAPGVAKLSAQTSRLLNAEGRSQAGRMLEAFAAAGAPPAEAAMVAKLYDMDGAVGLARLARDSKIDPLTLTGAFTDLGARLGLDWAQMTAARMSPSDPWERLLVAGLARDFQQVRLDFLRRRARAKAPGECVANWAEEEAGAVRAFRAVVGRAQSAAPVAPAMLAQIASQARNLLGR
ncbi:NAD-glutamate dehydrogenase domain-containing protein [Novosphingobium sp. Gsoil 351]|uniref:NAD-glutamate dehydrogenase n=1 Tax=Novosphingobium sp. Gsoil 351 TaxID=2675225 RepID=UPI0012B459D2|nr:NAD-glutamate dehydrogenase domain-containing protein [Novosphingobium sp. Gsoil 351]QGN55384.1 glutamate dehydrogenase [Novosphingobium sp. Gsoil 351]